MGKGIWIGLIVIVLLAIGGFWIFGGEKSQGGIDVVVPNSDNTNAEVRESEDNSANIPNTATNPQTHTAEITSSGFSPKDITIKAGDKVVWVNRDSEEHWPASAMHPTHKVYPGSDIEKCGTAEEDNIFDACKGLSSGESYEFIFNEKGKWNYHDHLDTSSFGSVTVE